MSWINEYSNGIDRRIVYTFVGQNSRMVCKPARNFITSSTGAHCIFEVDRGNIIFDQKRLFLQPCTLSTKLWLNDCGTKILNTSI